MFLRCFLGIFHKFIECLVFSKGCSGTFWVFFFGGFSGAFLGVLRGLLRDFYGFQEITSGGIGDFWEFLAFKYAVYFTNNFFACVSHIKSQNGQTKCFL